MGKFYLTSIMVLALSLGLKATDNFAFNSNSFIMEESVDKIEAIMSGNRLVVKNLKEDSVLEVYSIVGVKVYSREIKAGTNEYPLNLPRGYYIIRIGDTVKKIAIRQ